MCTKMYTLILVSAGVIPDEVPKINNSSWSSWNQLVLVLIVMLYTIQYLVLESMLYSINVLYYDYLNLK